MIEEEVAAVERIASRFEFVVEAIGVADVLCHSSDDVTLRNGNFVNGNWIDGVRVVARQACTSPRDRCPPASPRDG